MWVGLGWGQGLRLRGADAAPPARFQANTQKQKEAADNARLAREAAKRAKATEEQLAWLQRQVEEKEEKKKAAVADMREYTAHVVQKAEVLKEEEAVKKLMRKERDLRHQAGFCFVSPSGFWGWACVVAPCGAAARVQAPVASGLRFSFFPCGRRRRRSSRSR